MINFQESKHSKSNYNFDDESPTTSDISNRTHYNTSNKMISEREDSRSSTQTASAYYRRRNRGDRLIVGRGLRPRGPQDEDADAIITTGAPSCDVVSQAPCYAKGNPWKCGSGKVWGFKSGLRVESEFGGFLGFVCFWSMHFCDVIDRIFKCMVY